MLPSRPEQEFGHGGAGAASMHLQQHLPIAVDRSVDILVKLQVAIGQDGSPVAVLSHRAVVMGDKNDIGVRDPLAKSRGTLSPETLVADFSDLVDQIDIEIDSKTRAECQTGAHARRIGIDGHVEIFAELGKLGDIASRFTHIGAIDTAIKAVFSRPDRDP
jgi:hypothetical protein